jgi:osmotically-inducible protein OsmY
MQDHAVDATDIEVLVKDGEVTFSGTVTSRDQKRRAEELAERCNGVSEITNNLRLSRSTTTSP